MKTLNRLKLSQLNDAELEQRQMDALRGGYNCGCGCNSWNETGVGTVSENYRANLKVGYGQSYGGNVVCGDTMPATADTH